MRVVPKRQMFRAPRQFRPRRPKASPPSSTGRAVPATSADARGGVRRACGPAVGSIFLAMSLQTPAIGEEVRLSGTVPPRASLSVKDGSGIEKEFGEIDALLELRSNAFSDFEIVIPGAPRSEHDPEGDLIDAEGSRRRYRLPTGDIGKVILRSK